MFKNRSNRSPQSKKSVFSALSVLFLAVLFLNRMKLDVTKYMVSSPAEIPEINRNYNQAEIPVSSENTPFSPLDSNIRYASLSDHQKDAYNALHTAIEKHAPFINIEHNLLLEKDFDAVWNAFWYTDPYLLATGAIEVATQTVKGRTHVVSVKLNYNMDKKALQECFSSTQEMVKKIVAKTNGMSDYDKAKYFHDYLVLHSTYSTMLEDNTVHTAYGCLVNGYCVCEGYARAYKLLCDEAGIPCELVVGGKETDTDHIWNLVLLNGTWLHVDVTYDDPVGAPENYLSHDYFGLTTAEITKDHLINREDNFPMP